MKNGTQKSDEFLELKPPTWKQHLQPLLFVTHLLNFIWIARIFYMNFEGNRYYFFDFYFLFFIFLSLIFQIILWKKFSNESIYLFLNNVESLKNLIRLKINYLYRMQPYYYYFHIPIENGLDNADYIFFKNDGKIISSNKIFLLSLISKEDANLKIMIGFFSGLILYLITLDHVSGVFRLFINNWIVFSFFHIMCIGVIFNSAFKILFFSLIKD